MTDKFSVKYNLFLTIPVEQASIKLIKTVYVYSY